MFTTKDFSVIPRDYFTILNQGAFSVTLQSKCTKHCWHLLIQEYGRQKNIHIMHTHKLGTSYHDHSDAVSLKAAISKIRSHDVHQLKTVKIHGFNMVKGTTPRKSSK